MRLFVVGAGASAAAPSCMPIFTVLRKYLITRLGLADDVVAPAGELAPERFMQSVYDGGLPLERWLTKTLSAGEPNAVHHVLADCLNKGDTIWTVNVDELIEEAVRSQHSSVVVAAFDDNNPSAEARLLKPHGTVSRGMYIFRTDQVIRPLPDLWARRLQEDGERNEVVVIGYAGADLDMRVALDDMFEASESVVWFARRTVRSTLLDRFPALKEKCSFLGGEDDASLTPAFLEWADQQGLTANVSESLRTEAARLAPLREPANLPGDARFAAALTLERIGDRAGARRAYQHLLFRRPLSRAVEAARRIRTIDLYGGARWTRPLLAIAASDLAPVLPHSLRVRLDRVHVTLLSSHRGDHSAALDRAQRVADPDDPAIIISVAKAHRFSGDYPEALHQAARAEQIAASTGEVDILAHALYEQAFSLTWSGRLAAAHKVVGRLYSAIDGLAGTRWVAWAAWQQACLLLYGNGPDKALGELRRAESLFRADQLDSGIAAALTVQLTSHRMLGDDASFNKLERDLETMTATPGWTSYTNCSVNLERAEHARDHHSFDQARDLYERVLVVSSDEPIHLSLALLGIAELDRAEGGNSIPPRERVRLLLGDHPMAYIAAHLAIADYLADSVSDVEALDRIAVVAPELPTKTGRRAVSPLDFCLGMEPASRGLFLP